jgi:hypothetical protein
MQQQKNVFEFITDQLGTNPTESKKFLMALVGIIAIFLQFVVSAVLMFYRTDLGAHLVAMFTIAVPSLAGIVAIYLGAQGAVEVKANGVLQHQAQDLASKL